MLKIILGAIVTVFAVIGGFIFLDKGKTIVNGGGDGGGDSSTTNSYIIEGDVVSPGTYKIKGSNVTMNDLIEAAGGLKSTADERSYNSTVELTSGSTYFIGSRFDASDVCNINELAKVNINTDDADTLTTVTGFTNSIASSIVSYRYENGNFTTIEGLLDVYGIGNATYRKVRNYVILHE